MLYDAIIIGKGPAGLSAALYTIRANLKTLVLGTNSSVLLKAEKIENYYGFSEPVGGKALIDAGIAQVLRIGGTIRDEEVVGIEQLEHFHVTTLVGHYEAKTVLIATGSPVVRVPIKNLDKFEGAGVSYCTTCDGFFYRNKRIGVLGYNDYAVHERMELVPFTKDVLFFTNGKELSISDASKAQLGDTAIYDKKIASLEGEETLERVVFEDGSSEAVSGLFVAYGSASGATFALKMGIEMNGNAIVVNTNHETNIPGLYAAGDVTGGFKQVAVAVGQGALAGRRMIEFARKNK